MKKFIIVFCLFINLSSHAKDLQVGWELWYPYQYRNSQQELLGLDIEIFNAVFAKAGYTSSVNRTPMETAFTLYQNR